MSFSKIPKIYLSSIFLLLFWNCSEIKVVNTPKRGVSAEANGRFSETAILVKDRLYKGAKDEAKKLFLTINPKSLSAQEKLTYEYLYGLIQDSYGNFEAASKKFQYVLKTNEGSDELTAQAQLAFSATLYKLNKNVEASASILKTNEKYLEKEEKARYFQLRYFLSLRPSNEQSNKDKGQQAVQSLYYIVNYLSKFDEVHLLEKDPLFYNAMSEFPQIELSEAIRFVKNDVPVSPIRTHLGVKLVENLVVFGRAKDGERLLDDLKSSARTEGESDLIKKTQKILERYSKINLKHVGLILPLSGSKKRLSLRALIGATAGSLDQKMEIFIEDTQGNGVIGAKAVRKLVNEQSVSIIIGGMYPDEALEEYKEASKYGVLFISLSPVFAPSKDKNFLLIELPGSLESQMRKLFSENVLDIVGKDIALMYPFNSKGRSFVDKFWEMSKERKDVKISAVQEYSDEEKDYQIPIKKLLGLEFEKERKEELELVSNIYNLESKSNIRRIQTLPPIVDFDWVMMPANPDEALRMIPTFKYFDVSKVSFVGGPQWRSKMLLALSDRFKIFFLGDNLEEGSKELTSIYQSKYKRRPTLVEMIAYSAFSLSKVLIHGAQNISERFDFHEQLKNMKKLSSAEGHWSLENGLWLKDLQFFRMVNGRIELASKESGRF